MSVEMFEEVGGSGVPDKTYDSEEVYELIHIANCFYF